MGGSFPPVLLVSTLAEISRLADQISLSDARCNRTLKRGLGAGGSLISNVNKLITYLDRLRLCALLAPEVDYHQYLEDSLDETFKDRIKQRTLSCFLSQCMTLADSEIH